MFLLTWQEETDIEQETALGILESAVRIRGNAARLAQRAGISPVHLSYIRRRRRMPRFKTARRIAAALPLPGEQQQRWLYHVERYWKLKYAQRQDLQRAQRETSSRVLVEEIQHAHHATLFASDTTRAPFRYRSVHDVTFHVLSALNPNRDPISYLELGFVIHDVLCALDRNAEALWYAKRIRRVSENLNPRDYPDMGERIAFFCVNALRAEAIAYHNLGLERQALGIYQDINGLGAFQANAAFWLPHLNRDKLNALAGMARFSIAEAEYLEQQARRVCETRADAYDPLLGLLLTQSLCRAYLRHGNYGAAEKRLLPYVSQLETIPHVGPLHRVLFWRALARLYWMRGGACSEWKFFVTRALRLARDVGLEHQWRGMTKEFPLLQEPSE